MNLLGCTPDKQVDIQVSGSSQVYCDFLKVKRFFFSSILFVLSKCGDSFISQKNAVFLWHTNVPYVGVEAHVIGCFLKLQGRVGDSKFMVTIGVPG